ncbi:ERMES complex subunit [Tulasnella sp. JGI-2019a]|nr:ERMES complex subunit [Tulasnella sp. JGI-2019a]
MSFHFNWPRFSDQFHVDATQMLNAALNKGNKPRIIADKIEVVELSMGTQPPELEIRDIGELTTDQFRGIFRLSYAGDAHIVLRTKVQANPLTHKKQEMDIMGQSRGVLAAHQPLVVPMLLRLSHFKLNAYVVLVVSKQKGITLVFKTDPLQSLDVNSTFDSIAVIQKFIQKEIEGQLREMFREDLPGIIHRLSQKWTAGKTKVEAPYLHNNPTTMPREMVYSSSASVVSTPSPLYRSPPSPARSLGSVGLRPTFVPRPLSIAGYPAVRSRYDAPPSLTGSAASFASKPRQKPKPVPVAPQLERTSSFPDLENYDPTYGLRPEGLPLKSKYSGFGQLFTGSKGLADISGSIDDGGDDVEEDGEKTFDMVEWDEMIPDYSTYAPSSVVHTEYETLPAVGGGTVSRPRVIHSQSQIGLPPSAVGASTASSVRAASASSHPTIQRSTNSRSSPVLRHQPSHHESEDWVSAWREQQLRQNSGSYFPEIGVAGPSRLGPNYPAHASSSHRYQPTIHSPLHPDDSRRHSVASAPHRSSSSSNTGLSFTNSDLPLSVSTPPSSDVALHEDPQQSGSSYSPEKRRRRSLSPSIMHRFDTDTSSSPPKHAPSKIVLRPHINITVSHLSTLSQSNHTLSPYTHSLEHFTVRSVPPRIPRTPEEGIYSSALLMKEKQKPVKARRKRMINLAKRNPATAAQEKDTSPSPSGAPSEFSDDVDHYFRAGDSYDPDIALRRRQPYPPAI